MATFSKLPSGAWRVQVRRKGRYVSETFLRREDARLWALDAERQVDRNDAPVSSRIARLKTFGDLVDLHISDMAEVGKAPLRSKAATLDMLKRELGTCNMAGASDVVPRGGLHGDQFVFNDKLFPLGLRLWASLAGTLLQRGA